MRVEIYWIGGATAGRLAIMPRPRGGDWLEDEVRSLRACGVDVLVSLLTAEEVAELDVAEEASCCAGSGIEFLSFPITDRGVPPSSLDALALVRSLATRLSEGKSVAVHCRQGVGRSALIAAAVLACLGERADAAFERVTQATGCPVPDTAEQRQWVVRLVEKHMQIAGGMT